MALKKKKKINPAKQKSVLKNIWLPIFLVGLLALISFGYLDQTIALLDSEKLSYKNNDFSLSAYDVIKGLVAIISLYWVTSLLSNFGDKRIQAIGVLDVGTKNLLIKVFHIALYSMMILIGLDVLNIDLKALTFLGGAIGIGVGFGLQKITSNFISGIILLFEKSINNGDLIQLADGTSGFVRKLGTRHTLIETFDGREIMMPNESFITQEVVNLTYSNKHGRIAIPIGVSYDSDIALAKNLMIEAALENKRCSQVVEPQCYLVEFADNSINFLLHFWVDDVVSGRYQPKSEVLFAIWDKFGQNNISIPFPQRDVHIIEQKVTDKISQIKKPSISSKQTNKKTGVKTTSSKKGKSKVKPIKRLRKTRYLDAGFD